MFFIKKMVSWTTTTVPQKFFIRMLHHLPIAHKGEGKGGLSYEMNHFPNIGPRSNHNHSCCSLGLYLVVLYIASSRLKYCMCHQVCQNWCLCASYDREKSRHHWVWHGSLSWPLQEHLLQVCAIVFFMICNVASLFSACNRIGIEMYFHWHFCLEHNLHWKCTALTLLHRQTLCAIGLP